MVSEVATLVVGFSSVIGILGGSLYWLGRKFAQIDERFERVEGEIRALREYVNRGFEELRGYVDRRFE